MGVPSGPHVTIPPRKGCMNIALLERLWNLDRVKDIGEVIKMVRRS